MKPLISGRIPMLLGWVLFLAGAGALAADSANYLRWRGRVDGSDILRVRGRSVQVQHQTAQPIRDARYEFSAPLPSRDVRVWIDVRQGRGRVELQQEPFRGNNYTAVILLDDERQPGGADYEFYLYWEPAAAKSPDSSAGGGSSGFGAYDFVWEGRVDGADYLFVRDRSAWIRHIESQPVEDERYDFRTALPQRAQTVQMDVQRGRGRVTVEEQPSARNNYTLKILLDDTQRGGSDFYRLGLRWSGGGDWKSPADGYRGMIHWRGTVDGRDRLFFQKQTVDVRHLEARPIRNMQVDFSAPLPREVVEVRLNVVRGRGDVRIIEQHSRSNGWAAVVEVDDPKNGDDDYEFELTW